MAWGLTNIPDCKWNLEVNHPVKSFWASDDPTSPAELWGGTWVRIDGHKTLIAAEDGSSTYSAGRTGGEETHLLTAAELPEVALDMLAGANGNKITWGQRKGDAPNCMRLLSDYNYEEGYAVFTAQFGGRQAHNNMQPYYCTYIWQRIA